MDNFTIPPDLWRRLLASLPKPWPAEAYAIEVLCRAQENQLREPETHPTNPPNTGTNREIIE